MDPVHPGGKVQEAGVDEPQVQAAVEAHVDTEPQVQPAGVEPGFPSPPMVDPQVHGGVEV